MLGRTRRSGSASFWGSVVILSCRSFLEYWGFWSVGPPRWAAGALLSVFCTATGLDWTGSLSHPTGTGR